MKNKRAAKLQYWKTLNEAYESSGLKQKEFCLSQGINYKAFSNHRHHLKKAKNISLQVTENVLSAKKKSIFIPVKVKAASETNLVANKPPLVLWLRERVKLQIPVDVVNAELLQILFRSLEVM